MVSILDTGDEGSKNVAWVFGVLPGAGQAAVIGTDDGFVIGGDVDEIEISDAGRMEIQGAVGTLSIERQKEKIRVGKRDGNLGNYLTLHQ